MPTWTGAGVDNNWSTAGNWDTGVPSSTTPAIFSGNVNPLHPANKNCIITSGANCTDFNLTGYKGTITFTNTLNLNVTATAGNLTFSAEVGFSMVGPNGINWAFSVTGFTRTITTNGYNFDLPITSQGLGGNILTVVGTFRVSAINNITTGFAFNGGDVQIIGNLGGLISGTSNKILVGNGTMPNNCSCNNVVINAPGFTRTFVGSNTITTLFTWTAGSIISTANTITLTNMVTINLGGQTFNNFTFSNTSILTCTVTGDFTLTGNIILIGGGAALNGTGKAFVQGNVTGQGSGGTFTVEMTGTSTLNGPVNNNVIINTPGGVVTLGPTNEVTGARNLTLTAGTLNLANNLIKRGGTTTITSGFLFTGAGDLVFRDVQFSPTTHTLFTNGVIWPTNISINPSTNIANTLVLGDNLTVAGNFSSLVGGSANQAHTINGSSLFVRGDFIVTTTGGIVGTTNIVFEGPTSMNWTMNGGSFQNNLNINKDSGASTSISGTFTWGLAGRTLQRTGLGSINPGTSNITIPNASVTINNMVFNNLTVTAGTPIITQNQLNTINGSLVLLGNATFAGTAGWTAFSFTHGGAGTTCTLKAGVTYTVQGGIFTMIGTAASRAILQSDDAQNVTVNINAFSDQMTLVSGTIPAPAAGYILGSRAFTGTLPSALSNLLPNRPTIASGPVGAVYTLTAPIGVTNITSALLLQVGKKAFFNVFGTTSVVYAATRDIDSNGGITIYAGQSFPDSSATSPNQFRTLNWEPLIAPSGSVYYTFVS